MSERRWRAGDEGWCHGIHYRVVQGRKGAGDLRLELHLHGEWQPAKMELGFLFADFFFENEHALYPRANGNRGGFAYLRAIQDATRYGWEAAQRELRGQRLRKALRQCLPGRYQDGNM